MSQTRARTRTRTSVHTDSSPWETHPCWIGLACIRQPPVGGGSRLLVSLVAVNDHLAQHTPLCCNA
ncbi:MAG: TauD/TfdA family dioxygenase [Prochlorococcaceae cyanobacterium]